MKILEQNVIILLSADLNRKISYLSRYLSFLLFFLYFGGVRFSFGVISLQLEKSTLSLFIECVCCCWILLIFLHEACIFPPFLKDIMFPGYGIVDWQTVLQQFRDAVPVSSSLYYFWCETHGHWSHCSTVYYTVFFRSYFQDLYVCSVFRS